MATVQKYLKLAKSGTTYSKKMTLLSNRIFGEVTRPASVPLQTKVTDKLSKLPVDKDPDVVDYYHRLPEAHYLFVFLRQYGLFRDEHADFTDEMKRQRKLRGKTHAYPGFKPNPDRPTKFASLKLK
ncbi:28S ribosomal protein S33, mitochondrial [Thrips palmi]|uniref:Small ribosomal subunit protein mS33 n=1 Tax=Thrips palmi TaxID=161013 RepID=A0A6P8YYX1_THRPL|nr:28S ribosomal protein S33, mitochondrial [Thrips palmi]